MTYKKYAINSIGELIDKLKPELKQRDPAWFRGHADASWKLLPGYQRYKNPPPESVLINKFKQNASLLVNTREPHKFEWLFYMQHYGAPTRLLDWSESPLFGLYFAVTSTPNKQGALWLLKPLELNKLATSNTKEAKFIPSFDDQLLDNYSTESIEANNFEGVIPMAAIATRNNTRIQAQLGVFTISHRTATSIENIGTGSHVTKFTISPAAKKTIFGELKLLGVNKFQLFPELSSAGDLIKESLT
ncbi:MAG: FRG domain-containing protein [Hydrogenophaga sp.]|uniref:FRG domain-containing protein n=1 Tax=Hydrogenophaga sp. TaxID=1904254 RepID=UPI0025BBBA91|nr:FRG domain-containing protein [Hydrogenophaga sp.]MBT9551309.1 FRG domain-containing protein [Hydrogenophaga sp.]